MNPGGRRSKNLPLRFFGCMALKNRDIIRVDLIIHVYSEKALNQSSIFFIYTCLLRDEPLNCQ